jgi:hypothetical protein
VQPAFDNDGATSQVRIARCRFPGRDGEAQMQVPLAVMRWNKPDSGPRSGLQYGTAPEQQQNLRTGRAQSRYAVFGKEQLKVE